MSKTLITLEDADLIELQQILLDADEAAALTFLQAHVAPNIPSKGTAQCDSSRRNPYLLQPDKPGQTRA